MRRHNRPSDLIGKLSENGKHMSAADPARFCGARLSRLFPLRFRAADPTDPGYARLPRFRGARLAGSACPDPFQRGPTPLARVSCGRPDRTRLRPAALVPRGRPDRPRLRSPRFGPSRFLLPFLGSPRSCAPPSPPGQVRPAKPAPPGPPRQTRPDRRAAGTGPGGVPSSLFPLGRKRGRGAFRAGRLPPEAPIDLRYRSRNRAAYFDDALNTKIF